MKTDMEINLMSDTVTKPTPEMLEAMMQAKVGDDVFKSDPSINALEEKVAELFGMEAALFFPSGTMTNQTAIKLHTQPGDQLICDKNAHIYNFEGGGISFNSGVSCKLTDGARGTITAAQVEACINPFDFYHSPPTTLVCVENTANKGGGTCWDFKALQEIRTVCDTHQLAYHLDGARLWNALVAKAESPKQYGALFDTISVCLSKGLGCPVGSLLVGSRKCIDNAMKFRKIFGGAMRQSGYLAAAGIYALDHHIDRLAEDHRRAKEIGEVLGSLSIVKSIAPVETNIIIFTLDKTLISEEQFLKELEQHQIYIIGVGQGKLRIVTHLDYTEAMHERLLHVLRKNYS